MHTTLATLIDRLDSPLMAGTEVIGWGCPVPSFGDLSNATVASVGLNPSNREFMDERGKELDGPLRRLHTLNSLGLKSWADVDVWHLRLIVQSCSSYFATNPYDGWFKRLDQVVSATGASFYGKSCRACHLDLIPYATARKWTELTSRQRSALLNIAEDTLGMLLRDSCVRVLLLNGQSVVSEFERIAGFCLDREGVPTWSLPRGEKPDVAGYSYRGKVSDLSGISLGREVLVLGFNHNLQSSFGVTKEVIREISNWISRTSSGALE
jgi:hypothetical protein